ncbi:hypothetical protein K439DRAFT_184952 [Ramaria rubella]|nr:hypothetical protein K439DRAFT_184952 [Ramaria rubella]
MEHLTISAGRSSPQALPTMNVLSNAVLSESPISSNHSTPAMIPAVESTDMNGLRSEDSVPPLQLDDIQSAIPFDGVSGSNEISATIAFPQENCPGSPQVPSVTITTSHRSIESSLHATTPPLPTRTFPEFIPSAIPFPRESATEHSSTSSSVLTEGDKLTDLPASFSAPRLQSMARKAGETPGIPSQDSFASSIIVPSSRRSGDSEHSSFAGKIRGDVTPKRVSFEGDRPSFSSSFQNVRNYRDHLHPKVVGLTSLSLPPTQSLTLLPPALRRLFVTFCGLCTGLILARSPSYQLTLTSSTYSSLPIPFATSFLRLSANYTDIYCCVSPLYILHV